jgi:signal transduction histidine kinase
MDDWQKRRGVQQQRLRAFLTWLTAVAGIFALLEAVAFVLFQDTAFGIASLISFGCVAAFRIAHLHLRHARLRLAAVTVFATIVAASLVSGIFWPTLLPMLVLLPLLALVMVLPFVWGRTLYGLILADWFVILAVAILAEVEATASIAPHWVISVFRIMSLGAVAALLLVLLVQFSLWLTELLTSTERANAILLSTDLQLTATLQEYQAATQRITRLQAVTAAFSEALTPNQVAQVILDQGIAALGAYAGAVVVVDPERDELETIAAAYLPDVLDPWQRFARTAPVPIAQTVATGQPLWLESKHALEQAFPTAVRPATTASAWVTLPLTVNGRTVGGLALSFATEQTFGADDRAFMLALAHQCAQALERARLYEAEQQARQEAQDSVRVRDVFLSVASHELKTPLTALIGYTEVLLRHAHREASFTERDHQAIASIAVQTEHLNEMIEVLLDISRITTGQLRITRRPLGLTALTERLVGELQPTLEQHILTLQSDGKPLLVAGDELRLRQVLSNLISNAVKYSPNGGEICICLEQREARVYVSVSDHGIGIPPSELPHLFRLFYRAANASAQPISGVGIGLAVVKDLVTLHGGTVEVASTEGEGSIFTICLPLFDDGDAGQERTH